MGRSALLWTTSPTDQPPPLQSRDFPQKVLMLCRIHSDEPNRGQMERHAAAACRDPVEGPLLTGARHRTLTENGQVYVEGTCSRRTARPLTRAAKPFYVLHHSILHQADQAGSASSPLGQLHLGSEGESDDVHATPKLLRRSRPRHLPANHGSISARRSGENEAQRNCHHLPHAADYRPRTARQRPGLPPILTTLPAAF